MENEYYPKWLYHPKKEPILVNSKEEHEMIGSKYSETPFEIKKDKNEEELNLEPKNILIEEQ